MFASGW